MLYDDTVVILIVFNVIFSYCWSIDIQSGWIPYKESITDIINLAFCGCTYGVNTNCLCKLMFFPIVLVMNM